MHQYIQANIRAHVPGLETSDDLKKIPNEPEIAYSHPPNPDDKDYEEIFINMEWHLADPIQSSNSFGTGTFSMQNTCP